MSWLVWYTLASLALAIIILRVVEYVVAGGVAAIVKPVVFVVSWVAVTAKAGMQRVTMKARHWRNRVDALAKGERS